MPPRKSKRSKIAKTANDEEEYISDTVTKPKVHTRRARGKRGSLANLPLMPLDVLFEASHITAIFRPVLSSSTVSCVDHGISRAPRLSSPRKDE